MTKCYMKGYCKCADSITRNKLTEMNVPIKQTQNHGACFDSFYYEEGKFIVTSPGAAAYPKTVKYIGGHNE